MSVASLGCRWISSNGLRRLSSRAARPFSHLPLLQLRSEHTSTHSSSLPRIAQSSTWNLIIPRALRNRGFWRSEPGEKKPTNPAQYFIWIYLFIGSQAIRIISVQNEFNTYMRKAEVKIGRLREVVEKLQKGEEVDVEKALGTGDEAQELEWEEAMKEIEEEERLWQNKKHRRMEEKTRLDAEAQDASPVSESEEDGESSQPAKKPEFY